MTTTIEEMAAWVTELELDDIPERVISKAKLQFFSIMAAVYAGYPNRGVRAIREIILSTRAKGIATVFPAGDRTSPTVAVVANAAASMALDYDDYLFMGHTGHSAVLASLGLAQESDLSGRQLLLAQVAANEIGGRLGASVILGPQNGQLWTHLHCPCAACVGSKLMNLDAQQTAHALAISLYQPPFAMWPGFMGPDSKLLSAAYPARDGLLAARAASWGLTGPLDILDSDLGFGQHFAHHYLRSMFTGLGQAWLCDTLSYKIHPGCTYLASSLDALFEAMQDFEQEYKRPIEPADVTRVSVRTNLFGTEMNRLSNISSADVLSPVRINFSIPHSLALGLKFGRLTPSELAESELESRRQEILSLAEKIEVTHDWSLTLETIEGFVKHLPTRTLLNTINMMKVVSVKNEAGRQLGSTLIPGPKDIAGIASFLWQRAPELVRGASRAAFEGIGQLAGENKDPGGETFDLAAADFADLPMRFGSQVTLRLRGGREISRKTDIPLGAAGRDSSDTAGRVRKKFREAATPLLNEQRVKRAIELIDDLENLDDLSELTEALCAG